MTTKFISTVCHSGETATKRKTHREKLATKGRLFDIQWKNIIPSMAGINSGGTRTQELMSTWVVDKNSILPQTKNFLLTSTFHFELCHCCWGSFKKIIVPDKRVSFLHCMISYKDNSYWIRDLESAKGTFVNGVLLEPLSPQEMVHGDIISLGISHQHPIFQQKRNAPKIVFYYQGPLKSILAPESVEKTFEEMPSVAASVFGNPLILSEILSSLPLRDLKDVRLVNKQWNKESSRWFYAKSLHVLPSLDCARWGMLVKPYYNNKNISTLVKIKSEPRLQANSERQQLREELEEYIPSLISYLQNNGENIRTLDLEMDAKHLHVFTSELKNWRNIKELNLCLAEGLRAFTSEEMSELGKNSAEGLPNVERFSFDFSKLILTFPVGGRTDVKNEEFLKSVLKMLPSLSNLSLGTSKRGFVSPRILAVLQKNPELVENFEGFSIWTYEPQDDFFKHCEIIMSFPFKKPLKSLGIGKFHAKRPVNGDNVEKLTKLIQKFSGSLEHLSLGIGYKFSSLNATDLLTLTIPSLPKLKSLELVVSKDAEAAVGCSEHFWFNFPNPDGLGGVSNTVNYAAMFPALQTLIFKEPVEYHKWTGRHKTYFVVKLFGSKTMGPFIPRVGDVKCESLTKLVLPKLWRKSSDPEYREWLTRLTEIFPNVHSPLFRTVRAGKWEDLEEEEAEQEECDDSDVDVPSSDDDDNSKVPRSMSYDSSVH